MGAGNLDVFMREGKYTNTFTVYSEVHDIIWVANSYNGYHTRAKQPDIPTHLIKAHETMEKAWGGAVN